MRPVNPYIVGNPIKEQAGFFGRQDIFRDVMQVLRQRGSNAIVLYGQRRIGKTSVLLQLEKQLAHEGEFTPVYFDLQDKAAKSLPEVLYELSQHISRVTGHTVAQPADFNRTGDYFRSTFLPQIAEKVASGGLVLLFDEFDVLDSPMRTQASEAFFPYLRQWMTDLQKVKFVFVIGRRPEDLSVRTMSTFKGIQSTRVSFLTEKDAQEVARQSEQDGSLKWEKSAIQQVIELSHGHPYFTQLLCSVIWEDAYESDQQGTPTVSAQNVDAAVPQALKFGANAFNWLWDGLPPAERVVVAAMAEIKDEVITQDKLIETLNQSGVRLVARELEFAPETLIDWEVLIQSDGGYRFAVPLLRRWVLANRPLRRVKDELDRLDPLADTLFQAGQGFYNNNNSDAAEQQLRQALNINPNHLKARLLLGRILLEKGKLADSVDMFDAAYQYDERAARADFIKSLLALADIQDENLQLSTYERILKIQEDQPLAKDQIRIIWVKRGETAQAQENYEEALKAFEQIGDSERVEKVRTLMREKKLAAEMQKAEAYEKLGQWKLMLDVYAGLTSEYPDNEMLRMGLEGARAHWRSESLKRLEEPESEESWEKALEICAALEKDFPDDEEIKLHVEHARAQLGVVQKYHEALGALQSGQADQARQMFSQVLAENPRHLNAAHKLIEATYGKVKITRPVPWEAGLLAGFTTLLWIVLGALAVIGLVWVLFAPSAFRTFKTIPIEAIIWVAVLMIALVSTVVLYAGRALELAFQVDVKGKPRFWNVLWAHFPLGLGLFYTNHTARRKWLYPFLALVIPMMLLTSPFLIKNAYERAKTSTIIDFTNYYDDQEPIGEVTRASAEVENQWNLALGVVGGLYLLSFADVLVMGYLRRGKSVILKENIQKTSQSKPLDVAETLSSTLSYGKALLHHLLLGRGLFYVDPKARRRWIYPFFELAIPVSLFVRSGYEYLNSGTLSPNSGTFSVSNYIIWENLDSIVQFVILIYALSFFDVIFTLYVFKRGAGGNPGLAAAAWWPVLLAVGSYSTIFSTFSKVDSWIFFVFFTILILALWWISNRNVSLQLDWRYFLVLSIVYSLCVSFPYTYAVYTSRATFGIFTYFMPAIKGMIGDAPAYNWESWNPLESFSSMMAFILPIISSITFLIYTRRYGGQNYLTTALRAMILGPIVGFAVGWVWSWPLGQALPLFILIFFESFVILRNRLTLLGKIGVVLTPLVSLIFPIFQTFGYTTTVKQNMTYWGILTGIVAMAAGYALLQFISAKFNPEKHDN